MMFLMSQDRPSSRDGSTKIINMNHVLTHPTSQLQYNNNNNNLIINKNHFLAIETANNANSHLLVHKNMNTMPSISSTTSSIASPMSYITTINDQNVINGSHHQIVLLTNEKVESSDNEQIRDEDERKVSNGATDEELTPLTWLHDKNLLKGINLSCPKVQSPSNNHDQVPNNINGHINVISKSPQHDKDDSGMLDTGFNSSSEQNDHYSTPPSPKPINYTKTDSKSQTDNFIKNLDKNSHNNLSNSPQIDIIKLVAGHPSTVIREHNQSYNLNSEESINQIIKSPPNTPHQHFHKRYLRETLKQQDEEKRQQEQLYTHNSQLSSYIIAKPQSEHRYIFNNDEHAIANYNNNNNNTIQNNYENNCEYDLSQKAIDYAMPKLNSTTSSVASSLSSSPSPKQQKQHPNNIPYDPLVHINSKPPYSFSSLIFMAIEDSAQKALPVKEIYAWIIQHFPYFKTAPTGWKNSVRHNLSLNKCFQKVEKAANLGKGSLWMVEPQYRPNLIQALTRSPFHPCSTWEKHAKNLIKSPNESPGSKVNGSTRLPNPEHFPFLSRRLAAAMENFDEEIHEQSRSNTPVNTSYDMPQNLTSAMPIYQNNNSIIINGNLPNSEIFTRELNAETIDDVNAATAMLALKHGPKIFSEGIPFVQSNPPILTTTTSPSEDHTYSAYVKNGTDNNSNGTSSDAAYESSEENNVVYHFTQPLNEEELEEQRKQAEGVDALLNLAGYNTNTTLLLKRPVTDDQHTKQYFYTTEITPSSNKNFIADDEPPMKKSKSRILRNKLKKKSSWNR
ncbi:unnamed protein product [Chironomus riparius]|uniref:Fork-head domain-containing protein n=1 Tax=Chironomus riparius TaxID=315576 RepID=A0A9N9RZF0_9DIPT|nr:unnamed protein product [Chironomus riparius]